MQHSPHYRINIKTIPLQITTLTEEALALTCRSTCSFWIASDLLCFPCFLICNFFISFWCQVVEKFLSIMSHGRCLGYWNNKVHKELWRMNIHTIIKSGKEGSVCLWHMWTHSHRKLPTACLCFEIHHQDSLLLGEFDHKYFPSQADHVRPNPMSLLLYFLQSH